jgi:transcriptional regulator with AAA-type ATPase domain
MQRGDPETLTDSSASAASAEAPVRAAHLVVVMECARLAAGSSLHSLAGIDRVAIGRDVQRRFDRTFDGESWVLSLGVADPRASSQHAMLVRRGLHWFVDDLGSRNGTRTNGIMVRGQQRLSDGDLLEVGHTLIRYRAALAAPIGFPLDAAPGEEGDGLLKTNDPIIARDVEVLARLASAESPILLFGETGTGKEVLAKAIHERSRRRGDFVAINCGALPAALVEAQLFGHVRGAFSGALTDAPGLLRSADRGTILLDEIGDMPLSCQPALLRVLQEREVVPVGGTRPAKVNFLLIAATHQKLDVQVQQGTFRGDLFARLAGFTFTIPPLRERRDDIGLILQAYAGTRPIRLTPAAGRALLRYTWPRNVRELVQVLQVAETLAGGKAIDCVHLPAHIVQAPALAPTVEDEEDRMREQLVASLARHQGNVSQVARELGKARMQVQRWMKRFGIESTSFRRSRPPGAP